MRGKLTQVSIDFAMAPDAERKLRHFSASAAGRIDVVKGEVFVAHAQTLAQPRRKCSRNYFQIR
jgi:BMFP domain-containing protein YqiC